MKLGCMSFMLGCKRRTNERLQGRLRHLTMEAGEAAERSELLRRENERLLAQQKKQADEIQQLQSLIGEASSSRPVQSETPAGYRRATASDQDVFLRGDCGGPDDSDDDEDELKRRWAQRGQRVRRQNG